MGLGQIKVNWQDSLLQLSAWCINLTFKALYTVARPDCLAVCAYLQMCRAQVQDYSPNGPSSISCVSPAGSHLLTLFGCFSFSSKTSSNLKLPSNLNVICKSSLFFHLWPLTAFTMQLTMSFHAPLISHLSLSLWSDISHVSVMCWKALCLPLKRRPWHFIILLIIANFIIFLCLLNYCL